MRYSPARRMNLARRVLFFVSGTLTCGQSSLQSLTAWLEKRRAPKRRKHMEQLLEQYGCVGLEGFLRVTHALSLNDTFWVKEESEMLCWDEVSLYRNEFDALISQAAFSGVISEEALSSTSPEFGTDGYYAKC